MQAEGTRALDKITWLQKVFTMQFNKIVTGCIIAWSLLILIYGLVFRATAKSSDKDYKSKSAAAIILIVMEFLVTIGYPLTFYKLHRELSSSLIDG